MNKKSLSSIINWISGDIAIDLGTANTLIYVKGVGVVIDEPTLLAVNKNDNSVITIGKEAKKLIGRVPDTIE